MPLVITAARAVRLQLPASGGGGGEFYAGYTPTTVVTDAAGLASALVSATAGAVIGVDPGVYTGTPGSASRQNPVWKATNSGSSGNPIRVVAKYPAVLNQGSSGLWSELRSGHSTQGSGQPTFGSNGQNYVEWLGFYVNEASSYSAVDTGPVVLWNASYCRISHCIIAGAGNIWDVNEMHNGIRIEGSGTANVVRSNRISGFEHSGSDNNSNHAAIAVVCDLPGSGTVNSGTVEHNELYDCGAGFFIKKNYGDPGKWTVRYNYAHDIGGAGFRVDSLTDTTADVNHGVDLYQNLVKACGYAFMIGDSSQPDGSEFYVRIVNNTVIDCAWTLHCAVAQENSLHQFFNNVVVTATQAYVLAGTDATARATTTLNGEHNVFRSVSGTFAQTAWS